jgi:NADH:ubiquinone oxidoreductase subunit E
MLYGALDFYSEIRTVPPARMTVEWCSGPACLLKGSTNIRRVLESVLGCAMNENTPDGAFGLRLVQCDGTCHLAPLLRLEGKYLGLLSVSDAIKLARGLKGGTQREAGRDEEKPAGAPEGGEES